MDPLTFRVSALDGLPIHVREWPGDPGRPPLLCLPGLVRTGGDFEDLIPQITNGRRAIAIDYAGRGESGRVKDVRRYAPEACLGDVMDVCAAQHIHGAIVIGTSFGGLLAMGMAAARPSLVRAAVLNDIGPDIASEGADFVRDFVAQDPALASLEDCVRFLRKSLPPLSLDSDAAWRRMAALTYRPEADGRYHPTWDVRIARLLKRATPDLWGLFGALAQFPVLLVRGGVSNILLPDTVERMRTVCAAMDVVVIPDVGHAPTLGEPAARTAIAAFLERHA